MSEVQRSLTMMIYGGPKVGKSTLAVTSPYPRLLIDVENGHKFLPVNIKYWDPMREAPPVADGTWDTCVVATESYDTVLKAHEWLKSGQHQFKSLIIDSISELQDKAMKKIAGSDAMKMQHWGELLRHMGAFLRELRDLTMHPTAPLEAVVLIAMERDGQDGRKHPYLQGQLAIQAPYFYDILGAVTEEFHPNPNPMLPEITTHQLLVKNTSQYEAGERVQGRLGARVEQADLSVERMLDIVFKTPPPTTTLSE